MRFESTPVAEAIGAVLGHNVADADGRRLLRKGTRLEAEHCARLEAAGRRTVWVARLDSGDVDEDRAATRIAESIVGSPSGTIPTGVGATRARTGRVNLMARQPGVVRVDIERLRALNRLEGVTLATVRRHTVVETGTMIGTLKIIPYALGAATVATAARSVAGHDDSIGPMLAVAPPVLSRVGLVLSGSPGARAPIELGFRKALGARLAPFEAEIDVVDFVDLDGDDAVPRLAAALRAQRDAGLEMIILAGETAIMDRHDIAPCAVEAAGGGVIGFGAPVDPGNLLMLADLEGVPIVGAPGCARSPKTNVVDRVLPRLLVGDRLTRDDLVDLGHGGLLEDVPERRMPRSWVV